MNEFLKNAIIYEIYPTSFYDKNGDGIGDFKGITEKLDYVKELGANVIWLNPFYLSPFMDGGYDVKDYKKIDPKFGNMRDFHAFIKKCKALDIKVLVDLVVGHTSIEHEWFKRSARKRRNKYSDYYIWTDDLFTGYKNKTIAGMFERDGAFYVNYYGCQPALNFGWNEIKDESDKSDPYCLGGTWKVLYNDSRLTPVYKEIISVMKFWLKNGADGFRVDMAAEIVKGVKYDTPIDKIAGTKWAWDKILSDVKAEYPYCIMLAEWSNPQNAVYCGFDIDYFAHDTAEYNALLRCEKGTNILPAFENGNNYFSKEGKGSIKGFVDFTQKLHEDIDNKGYFSFPTGCHDEVRAAEKTGDKELKCAYAFLLTYKHIPMIYYGDEIGLKHNFKVSKDGGTIRTGARTPMQWNNGKNRGFSKAEKRKLYLPVNSRAGEDVESQNKDGNSLLNTVKKLIYIRRKYSCFNADAEVEFKETDYPLVFIRKDEKYSATVIINPTAKTFIKVAKIKEPLFLNDCFINGDKITVKKGGFAIFLNR